MTVKEAIETANELRPNAYSDNMKLMWLTELDGRIVNEILVSRKGHEDAALPDYVNGNRLQALLAPEPYTDIYIYWLFMKIDLMNGETERFNNDAVMYNTAWLALANHINRTKAPPKKTKITFEPPKEAAYAAGSE